MIRSTDLFETLAQLLRLPREQVCVEFKAGLNDPEAIGQYISAMSNAAALHGHDRAWIVWGVSDKGHAVGGTSFDPFGKRRQSSADHVVAVHDTAMRSLRTTVFAGD